MEKENNEKLKNAHIILFMNDDILYHSMFCATETIREMQDYVTSMVINEDEYPWLADTTKVVIQPIQVSDANGVIADINKLRSDIKRLLQNEKPTLTLVKSDKESVH